MKKLIVLAVAAMFATSAANAADMKWSGSAGWRFEHTNYDDQLNSKSNVGTTAGVAGKDISKQMTRTHAVRANLGVTGGQGNVEYGAAVRTTGATINTDYVSPNNSLDRAIGLSEAWFKYSHDFGMVDMEAVFGRQTNVFAYDASQQLFDNDVRFDGFAQQFKFGMFGLNMSQYILGAHTANNTVGASTYTKTENTEANPNTQHNFSTLIGFQPTMKWKFTDEINAMFAVGYYLWNYDAVANTIGGGYNSSTLNPNAVTGTVKVDNPKQWQLYTAWDLPFHLGASFEYIMNKKTFYRYGGATAGEATAIEADNKAWSLGLTYGKVRHAHDWAVGYAYGVKGLASVLGTYSNDKFAPDNKGHTVWAKYALGDNLNIGWRGMFLKEKSHKLSTGAPYSGANNTQDQKTNYWELTAGVTF